jgi:hypothetical protein
VALKILINIISGQTFPNFIATSIERPDVNVLLYTKESEVYLNNYVNALKHLGISHDKKNNFSVDAFDIEKIETVCKDILSIYRSDELILNYTGGTKPMSIATFSVFRELGLLLYVDSQSNKIHYYKNGKYFDKVFDKIHCDVKTYLYLSGYDMEPPKQKIDWVFKREKLTLWMMDYSINYIDEKGLNKFLTIRKNFDKVIGANYTSHKGEKLSEYFINVSERKSYANDAQGGWLEEWTFLKLSQMKWFDYVQYSTKPFNNKVHSEIDVFAIRNGIAYLFECKSGTVDTRNEIEKLFTNIQRYGGRFGKAVLVCFEISPVMKDLAKLLNITVLTASGLRESFEENIVKLELSPKL